MGENKTKLVRVCFVETVNYEEVIRVAADADPDALTADEVVEYLERQRPDWFKHCTVVDRQITSTEEA